MKLVLKAADCPLKFSSAHSPPALLCCPLVSSPSQLAVGARSSWEAGCVRKALDPEQQDLPRSEILKEKEKIACVVERNGDRRLHSSEAGNRS